jgi:hypothetical protein
MCNAFEVALKLALAGLRVPGRDAEYSVPP